MEDKTVTTIIILFSIIRTVFDIFHSYDYNKCYWTKNKYIFFVILIHALITSYMFLGWIYKSKKMMVIFLLFWLVILLHWITNNGQCFITQITNKICGFTEARMHNPNIFLNVHNRFNTNIFLNIFAIFGILISMYKLTQK